MSSSKPVFDVPKAPERAATPLPPIGPIALVQCSRNGAALAHILNWLGEEKPIPSAAWYAAFDAELNEHGLLILRQLCEACGVDWFDVAASPEEMRDILTKQLAKWQHPNNPPIPPYGDWCCDEAGADGDDDKRMVCGFTPKAWGTL